MCGSVQFRTLSSQIGHEMKPDDKATLHLRRGGTIGECLAVGRMTDLVERVMKDATAETRRLLVIVCGDMQYRAAEIQSLACRDEFTNFFRDRRQFNAGQPERRRRSNRVFSA